MLFDMLNLGNIHNKLENWWEFGEQKNPLLLIEVSKGDLPAKYKTNDLNEYWTNTEFIINRKMKMLENTDYYGIAVPFHLIDFGSSAFSGVLGARMECVDQTTIWAYEVYHQIEDIFNVKLDYNNLSSQVIHDVSKRSAGLSKGHHYIAPYALGGIGDNIAALYGTENLMIDLIEKPDEVKTAMEHIKKLWIKGFDDNCSIIYNGGNTGGIGWAGIWAPGRTFPIQEDFSYMISNDMFREFCLSHIADKVSHIEYPMYHLDGIAAIRHLDSLLELNELKVIQWVPGAGHWEIKQWYDLIKHIIANGKSVEVFAQVSEIDDLVANVGTRGILIHCTDATKEDAERLIEKYGKD